MANPFLWRRYKQADSWCYHERMKSNPKHSPEYVNFENAMRCLLRVSKADVNRTLAEDKLANAGKPKRGPKPRSSVSDHAVLQ